MKRKLYFIASVYMITSLIAGCGQTAEGEIPIENTEFVTEVVDIIEQTTEIMETEACVVEKETAVEETEGTEIEEDSASVDISAYVNAPYDLEMSKALFEMANQVRIENGVNPLEWDDRLYVSGAIRAEEATRVWSHTRPDGSKWLTVSDSSVLNGENLARGYSIEEVIDAWLASETHKENLLRAEFGRGAMVYYNDNGVEYWVHHFGY